MTPEQDREAQARMRKVIEEQGRDPYAVEFDALNPYFGLPMQTVRLQPLPPEAYTVDAQLAAGLSFMRARYGNAPEAWQAWPSPGAYAVAVDPEQHSLIELVRFVLIFVRRQGLDVVRAQWRRFRG